MYCERCGLQVGADMAIHRFDPSDYEDLVVEDADDDDEDDEWEAEERRERQQIVAALTFPLYGMPSHEWEIGGYGGNPQGHQPRRPAAR